MRVDQLQKKDGILSYGWMEKENIVVHILSEKLDMYHSRIV